MLSILIVGMLLCGCAEKNEPQEETYRMTHVSPRIEMTLFPNGYIVVSTKDGVNEIFTWEPTTFRQFSGEAVGVSGRRILCSKAGDLMQVIDSEDELNGVWIHTCRWFNTIQSDDLSEIHAKIWRL